jgi:predicted nucleic acid-binding protein
LSPKRSDTNTQRPRHCTTSSVGFASAANLRHENPSMTDRLFVDTNILLYAYDVEAIDKRRIAADLIRRVWDAGTGALSTQVLQEFYVNVTAKIPSPLSPSEARAVVSQYFVWHVELNTPASVIHASEIQERNRLSFWDALIVAAAARAGCAILYSEDFSHGQTLDGVRVLNPFLDPSARA